MAPQPAACWPALRGRVRAAGLGVCLCACLCAVAPAGAACPPPGETLASMQALRQARWQRPDLVTDAPRHALALALLDCLSDPDPQWRDELAFEALQAWMRGGRLDTATLRSLRQRLLATLAAAPDAAGFAQPFAALVLAEVARVDRLQPWMSADERQALVDGAARYLAGVRDHRGFDEREGWRHGVAHGADLLLQLSLNPQLQRAQAETLLAALAAQVMPPGEVAYRYGEPARLAAPVFYLARRDLLATEDWQRWFVALAARLDKHPAARRTQAGLAQRHNLGAFLTDLYTTVQESPSAVEARARLLPGLRQALRELE